MSFDEDLNDDFNSSIKCSTPARSSHCRLTNEPPSHDDLVDEATSIHEARCGQEHAASSPLTLPRTSLQLPKRPHLSQHSLLTPSPTTTSPRKSTPKNPAPLTRTAQLILRACSTPTTTPPSFSTPGQVSSNLHQSSSPATSPIADTPPQPTIPQPTQPTSKRQLLLSPAATLTSSLSQSDLAIATGPTLERATLLYMRRRSQILNGLPLRTAFQTYVPCNDFFHDEPPTSTVPSVMKRAGWKLLSWADFVYMLG